MSTPASSSRRRFVAPYPRAKLRRLREALRQFGIPENPRARTQPWSSELDGFIDDLLQAVPSRIGGAPERASAARELLQLKAMSDEMSERLPSPNQMRQALAENALARVTTLLGPHSRDLYQEPEDLQARLLYNEVCDPYPFGDPDAVPPFPSSVFSAEVTRSRQQRSREEWEAFLAGKTGSSDEDVVQPLAQQVAPLLADRFGARPERPWRLLYNGHATSAKISFKTLLDAMGVGTPVIYPAAHSGGPGVLHAFRRQGWFSQLLDKIYSHDARRLEGVHARGLVESLFHMLEDLGEGEVIVVDRGGPIVRCIEEHEGNPVADALKDAIAKGIVRFVAHNVDDLAELEALEGAYIVKLQGSEAKRCEIRIIGQHLALMAAREARRLFHCRIGTLPIYINGFGDVGKGIARALIDLGYPSEKIIVHDVRAEALAEALSPEWNCTVLDPNAPDRPDRAIAFLATSTPFLDGDTAQWFGKETLFFGASSGTKAVRHEELQAQAEELEPSKYRPDHQQFTPEYIGEGFKMKRSEFVDQRFVVRGKDGEPTVGHLFVGGRTANLYHEGWPDKLAILPCAVAAAAAQAAALEEAGTYEMDPLVARDLVRAHERLDLDALRPLLALYGDPDPHPLACVVDLYSFSEAPALPPPLIGALAWYGRVPPEVLPEDVLEQVEGLWATDSLHLGPPPVMVEPPPLGRTVSSVRRAQSLHYWMDPPPENRRKMPGLVDWNDPWGENR